MNKIAWMTDIHLDFLKVKQISDLCQKIIDLSPDAILLGGDIGDASNVKNYLRMLEAEIQLPIYFVLGNHDFYHSSITSLNEKMLSLMKKSTYLNWLPASKIVKLTESTCLIGHGSWADGRLGNYKKSSIVLDDYFLIDEFKGLNSAKLFDKLTELGDEAALFFQNHLPTALRNYRHILVLTHVPPFKESCWHKTQLSDDNFLPHFSCKAVGEVLKKSMEAAPHCQMTVLCGHSHGSGDTQILPNLTVRTRGSEYGTLPLPEIIIIE